MERDGRGATREDPAMPRKVVGCNTVPVIIFERGSGMEWGVEV